jgi:hypothetical protein
VEVEVEVAGVGVGVEEHQDLTLVEGAEQVGHSHPQVEVDQVDHFPQSEAAPADHLLLYPLLSLSNLLERRCEHLSLSTPKGGIQFAVIRVVFL